MNASAVTRDVARAAVLMRLAERLCPPASHLRVVDVGTGATAGYEAAGARITEVGPGAGRPGVHVRVDWQDDRLPLRTQDADLVLWDPGPALGSTPGASNRLRALLTLLAPGGSIVLPPAAELIGEASAQGLLTTHASDAAVALRDPRPAPELPTALRELDRTSCVDRARVLRAWARPPFVGPLTSAEVDERAAGEAGTALVTALREQCDRGLVEPDALPWPTATASSVRAAQGRSGCDVLAVMPHPDDESVYAGGTISGLTTAGARVHLIVATDGAGGRGGDDLGARRARELLEAAALLRVHHVQSLGWADGGKYRDAAKQIPADAVDAIRAWGLDRALAALVAAIRVHRPRTLLGLDPHVDPNYSLHGHHLALGILVAVAFHVAADPTVHDGHPPWAVTEHRVLGPNTTAAHADVFEIDRDRKRAALIAHASQSYSTRRLLEALDDPARPAVEVTRRVQARGRAPWLLARTEGAVRDAGIDWHAAAHRVLAVPRPRAALATLLSEQASRRPDDDAVIANIERLRRPDTVAVVTGQQVGVFGGPALTLTKALGAVALARRLDARGIPAVPVFWMATQDHDALEVTAVPELEGPWQRVPISDRRGPVGRERLGAPISAVIDRWLSTATSPEVRPEEVRALLHRTHDAGCTFADAFAAFLAALTRGTGLLLLDPADPAFAALSAPVLAKELFGPPHAAEPLAAARARLDAEVIPTDRDVLQVFFEDETGARRRLSAHADGGVRVGARWLPAAALRDLLATSPHRFTPAALLRPVVQDAVLPTIAYVGGPTEVRYLAQTEELYRWAGVEPAVVVPRPCLDPVGVTDASMLSVWGGVAQLRRDPRPYRTLGRAGLREPERRWLDRLESLLSRTPRATGTAPDRSDPWARDLRALIADAPGVLDGPRLRRTWSGPHGIGTRLAAEVSTGLAARLLRRMRAAMLRDGRRRLAPVVGAWNRTSPPPAERRSTTAELVARFGPDIVPAMVRAMTDHFPATVTVLGGVRP